MPASQQHAAAVATKPAPDTRVDLSGAAAAPAVGPASRLPALVRAARPRQTFTKNLLVLTAPALGGHVLTDLPALRGALVALIAFSGLSAAVYLANDIHDVGSDRCHPSKRLRPIASGELRVRTAAAAAATLALGSLGLAVWWSSDLASVLVGYLGIQLAYSGRLKHLPGLELLCVSSGFVLRVVAGGVAAAVELSVPFLVVVGVSALFMVAGKRYSEIVQLGTTSGTRRSLAGYSLRWLRSLWIVAAAFSMAGYAVAATGMAPFGTAAATWSLLSVPLFVAGVSRYAWHVRRGAAGSPETVVFGDRVLLALGVPWVLTLCTAALLT